MVGVWEVSDVIPKDKVMPLLVVVRSNLKSAVFIQKEVSRLERLAMEGSGLHVKVAFQQSG